MKARKKGPGLAKTRGEPLIRKRSLELWRSSDYRLRELFEAADVLSEGATRIEQDGATYYGSTSILITSASNGGPVPDSEIEEVTRALSCDPHARLRAVRIACLEAQVRSGAPMGRVRAEFFVRRDARGLRLDVEVEARVYADAEGTGPTTVKVHGPLPTDRKSKRQR
jgi:hypothetical protein